MGRASCLVAALASLMACVREGPPTPNPPSLHDRGGLGPDAALASAASAADASVEAGPPGHQNVGHQNVGHQNVGHQNVGREKVDLCALPLAAPPQGELSGVKKGHPPEPHCGDKEPFCDAVERSPDPSDACFVANENLRRAEGEIASGAARTRAALATSPWDGRTRPAMLDRVDAHLHLTADEEAQLAAQGFVVLDRLAYHSYAYALHDVFQEQLPLYVGIDSILHSVFQANGAILQHIETERLQPKLSSMLVKLRKTLASRPSAYDEVTRKDLDLFLAVPWALLEPPPEDGAKMTLFDQDAEASDLLSQVRQGELAAVTLFGRERMVDFSQYTPRGHYAMPPTMTASGYVDLAAYFRSMTWLSRLELNLVSRSCRSSQPGAVPDPAETPREDRDAMALADLVRRAGALADLQAFEEVYSVFAGGREDVSVPDLLALMQTAATGPGDAAGPSKLRAAIGDRFQRTARTHFMPQGALVLPAIATLFGARIVPDIAPLTRLVHDRVPQRFTLGADDVAYVLGHDRAKTRLNDDLGRFPTLDAALTSARADIRQSTAARKDLYGLWLSAVLHLSDPVTGVVPSFMKTDAYADLRTNSALVGFGQIRHNYVLLAGQGYDAYGCEIPDAYVEPAVGTYDALIAYAAAARRVDSSHRAYFDRVAKVLGTLRAIATTELSGAPLSAAQKRWLGMVAEYIPVGGYGDSGEPPKWTGWYYDLFPDRHIGADKAADFVADYFTLTNANLVRYLGAESPRIGVFIVDVNGQPRAMVGPVAKGYETSTPIAKRLTDHEARKAQGKSAAWLGYVAKASPVPGMTVDQVECAGQTRVIVSSDVPLGPVTVTPLDHHGDALYPGATGYAGAGLTAFGFLVPGQAGPAPPSPASRAAPPLPPMMILGPHRYGFEGVHVHGAGRGQSAAGPAAFDVVTGVGTGITPEDEGEE